MLVIPYLANLSLPDLARSADYPGTSVIRALSWLLSLLALTLTGIWRVSHVDDPPVRLIGLSVLPKKSVLTDYCYQLSHDHQRGLATLYKKLSSADSPPVMTRSPT